MTKKNATDKVAVENSCCLCGKYAELENDNGSYICVNCAESMSSHAVDMGY